MTDTDTNQDETEKSDESSETPRLKLKIPKNLREEYDNVWVSRVRNAVQSAKQRDDDLVRYDDIIMGRSNVGGDTRESPGSQFTDPLCTEQWIEWRANISDVSGKTPYVFFSAIKPEEEEEAAKLEEIVNDEMSRAGFEKALNDLAALAGRDPATVLYVEWEQLKKRVRGMQPSDPDTGELVDPEMAQQDDTKQYPMVPTQQDAIVSDGLKFTALNLADVYLYPPDATSLETATALFQRVWLTADNLVDGIDDYDYDFEAVKELVQTGPTADISGTSLKIVQLDSTGIDIEIDDAEGLYECFIGVGKMPTLRDENTLKSKIPAYLRDDRVLVMLCPDHQTVFKNDFYASDCHPFFRFCMLDLPVQFQGLGIPQLMDSLQALATQKGQEQFDKAEYETTPMFYVTKEWMNDYGSWDFFPGALVPRDNPTDIEPIQMPQGTQMRMEEIGMIQQRGQALFSAQGVGQLSNKERTNLEMQNVMAGADSKFSLYQQNFMMPVADVGAYAASLILKHRFGQEVSVRQLKSLYTITASSTTQFSSSSQRLQIAQAVLQTQGQYFAEAMQLPPDKLKMRWHAYRTVLADMNVRNPEEYLGPEPLSEEWMQEQQQQDMQAQEQMQAQGLPPAQQIQGQAGQGQPQQAQPQQNGASRNGGGISLAR